MYLKVKFLIFDRADDFILDEFFDFCDQNGIKSQFSIAKTAQQNEIVERMKNTF